MQRCQRTAGGDFEDRPPEVGSARARCPVEVPVAGLDQRRDGIGAIRRVEAMKRRQRACRGDFEDCARETSGTVASPGPAETAHPHSFEKLVMGGPSAMKFY